jgi:hypothetical protein
MREIEFDSETHTYRVGGAIVPGVTGILKDLSIMSRLDPGLLREASERGKFVHEAVRLYNLGDLDEESLHPSLEPYVRAWKRFCADHHYQPLHSETIIHSERWNYCGQLDTYGTWKQVRRRPPVMIDVKSGVADRVHGPQTAAYLEPLRDMGITGPKEVPNRAIVRLQPTGFYAVDHYNDPGDWSIFLAALTCYRFKQAAGLL